MPKLSEFQKRCKMLKQLGIEFHLEHEYRGEGLARKSHEVDIFKSVKIPFSAHELIGIMMNDGQFYLGGCCGNDSAVQDKIESMLRFGQGWVEIRDIEEIAEARIHHDGEASPFSKLKRILDKEVTWLVGHLKKFKTARASGKKVLDPWYQLAIVWHITKDFYASERPHPVKSENPKYSDLDTAIHTLERGLRYLAYGKLFDRNPEDAPQDNANRLVMLAKLFPALKLLNDKINTLAPPPLDGVALVRKAEPEEILTNGLGLCIYSDAKAAQRLIDLWTKEEEQFVGEGSKRQKPAASEFTIRPVRVTTSKGIEFL